MNASEMNDYADRAWTLIERIDAKINETCDNDPWFQAAVAEQRARKAAAQAEADREAAVKAAHPEAAARVAARRAARAMK